MKLKIALTCIFVFCLASLVSGQQKSDLQIEFEKWKTEVLEKSPEAQNYQFLMARVNRDQPNTATVKLGLSGFDQPYEISVVPLKIEKDSAGKSVVTELAEATSISTPSTPKPTDFHSPTMILFADPQANALEITFKFGENAAPKMILKLDKKEVSTGKITSVR